MPRKHALGYGPVPIFASPCNRCAPVAKRLQGGFRSGTNYQADTAARPFGEIGGEAVEIVAVLEPGVHRAHQHAILEGGEAEVERREEVGIGGHGWRL